jgi:CheY-like chemotaxis protein
MKQPDAKPCVLVVDADLATQKSCLEAIGESGFEALGLNDGQALLRAMENKFQKVRPAFLLIDVSLPMFSGFELIRRFQNHYERLKIPIFLMSKYESNEDKLEATSAGAQALLVKPVSKVAFMQAVEKVRMKDLKGEITTIALSKD